MEFQDIAQLVKQIVTDMRDSHVSLVKDVVGEMLKHTSADHDNVVRLVQSMERLEVNLESQQQTNEKRIRELEETRWKMAGVIALGSMLFGFAAAVGVRFIHP